MIIIVPRDSMQSADDAKATKSTHSSAFSAPG
jgi:hypothetical protein